MRISYKNTALGFLEDPRNMPIHTPDGYVKPLTTAEDYKLLYGLQEQFAQEGFADCFKDNVQFITQPFYEAYRKAEKKLREVVLETEIDDAGTFILQWPQHTQTIFYRIKSKGDGTTDNIEAFIVMFTKASRNDSYALDLSIYLTMEEHQMMDVIWKGFVEQGRDLAWWVADLMLLKTFMKYAEVESKVINAQKKERHLGIKYLNETNKNIEILDSTYFTTISRTEGFGVKGHFRLQPYGIGMKDRRLTWISDFTKNGYTRKAKILNTQ
jgi:hypothetical protein